MHVSKHHRDKIREEPPPPTRSQSSHLHKLVLSETITHKTNQIYIQKL